MQKQLSDDWAKEKISVLYLDKDISHSDRSLSDHLLGVFLIVKEMNLNEHVLKAGLFHSAYGTSSYSIPEEYLIGRPALAELIGKEAEQLVYTYCNLDRSYFLEWVAKDLPTLTAEENDILHILLADMLEQWEFRSEGTKSEDKLRLHLTYDGLNLWEKVSNYLTDPAKVKLSEHIENNRK